MALVAATMVGKYLSLLSQQNYIYWRETIPPKANDTTLGKTKVGGLAKMTKFFSHILTN